MATATLRKARFNAEEILERLVRERAWLRQEMARCCLMEMEQREPEPIDEAAAQTAREFSAALRAQVQMRIEQIKRAQLRLRDGTYGMCTLCGEPISALRLNAIPSAELCLRCQKLIEG